ncbi:MAG: LytTR family transcriptional regulator, partial [Bacteroidetes bacterium]
AKNTRAVSYLVKPFDMLTLKAAIELNIPSPSPETAPPPLYIRRGKELVQVHTDEIIRITSDRNYCDIFTPSGRLTSRTTLKNLQELLPADQFVRIHLKHIVRLDAITGVFLSEQKVRVGDTLLPIGRKFKQDFLDKIECL